jgi:hypothetical protein
VRAPSAPRLVALLHEALGQELAEVAEADNACAQCAQHAQQA